MKQFISFVKKEFFHVLRDKTTLFILFGLPLVQILIFGFALTNEVKNAKVVVLDQSKDYGSQQLIEKVNASNYFDIKANANSMQEVDEAFKKGEIKVALIFPSNFYEDLMHQKKASVQIIADASDPNYATTVTTYMSAIVNDYQKQINGLGNIYQIEPHTRMIYNPQLKSVHNFVPGVMALVLMLVCVMMTAVSIVREKEKGTMEVLLVSPVNPLMIVVSKAIPYLLLSLINVTNIILISTFVLQLPFAGSLTLLYFASTIFIITCLSLGMIISVITNTQEEAMLISLMGMLMPTMIFSGFMFPIENMPLLLQYISDVIPARWYFIIVKNVMVKGVGLETIWKELLILVGMTILFLIVAVKKFKTRLE